MAAYVGDVQIADTRVQAVYDEVHNAPAAGGSGAAQVSRADVVAALVGAELLPEVAKQHGVSLPAELPVESYASALGLPANAEYTRLYVQASMYANQLLQKVTGGPAPTDADLREVYDALIKASGGSSGATTFEQFKGSLNDNSKQAVQAAVGVRNEIDNAAAKADLRINPRFQPAALPLLQTQLQNGEVVVLMTAPLAPDDKAPVSPAPVNAAP
ncbi:hypothetical protein ODJ79_41690 [Actinoplanes sp. KI2]|uniref:hypothetical protein n=1 Tax=Actinoplanes sp. KI2 TaxID=2983315 RepID=UPI0021D5851B|nr:hypothetical protein [Actinoplanes sp. KI2]MCU7730270.1 hypothetical protein [Actinoplanes sp. KI2]